MPRERWQGEDYYWDNYEFRRPRQRRLSPSPTGRRYNRSQFNNYEYDGRSYAEVARAARSRMPNPTEQQWAPRGNTRAQFNDNRRGPRRREDRSYPRRRRYDDHQQKERRRPSRDQGDVPEDKGDGSGPIGTHRQISPPVLTRNSRLKPVAYLDLLKPRITWGTSRRSNLQPQ
ncbi:hypothetical protein DPEC_G00094820 [Dallia pectoralis]|uniref:Uncharacterized protein n=1 Tax=Dallia pectoralis TaxID=75939 RepID=A0ACC2H262_DALPE|nr:hypothetical protein DPEC_G00094820 [Dallia pectoralis]